MIQLSLNKKGFYALYIASQRCSKPHFVRALLQGIVVIKTRFVIIYYKTGWENITIWVDSYNPFRNKNPNCNYYKTDFHYKTGCNSMAGMYVACIYTFTVEVMSSI